MWLKGKHESTSIRKKLIAYSIYIHDALNTQHGYIDKFENQFGPYNSSLWVWWGVCRICFLPLEEFKNSRSSDIIPALSFSFEVYIQPVYTRCQIGLELVALKD